MVSLSNSHSILTAIDLVADVLKVQSKEILDDRDTNASYIDIHVYIICACLERASLSHTAKNSILCDNSV